MVLSPPPEARQTAADQGRATSPKIPQLAAPAPLEEVNRVVPVTEDDSTSSETETKRFKVLPRVARLAAGDNP